MGKSPKFKGLRIPPAGAPDYGFISIPFFGEDKDELINALNEAGLPYSSLAHFVRVAINDKLKAHGVTFHITER